MSAPTIAEFLEARIAEDEAVARLASESDPFSMYGEHSPAGVAWESLDGMVAGEAGALWDCEMSDTLCTTAQISDHIARHDPARVLAECAAKRAIIAAHPIVDDVVEVSTRIKHGFACETCFSYGDIVEDNGYCDTLRALAAVYADHADYDPEWAS